MLELDVPLTAQAERLVELLEAHITPARRQRIESVLAERTFTVVPVLDGIYDQGNVAAVLRSTEALGFGGVHVIESLDIFKKSQRISQGAEKWLEVERWPSASECGRALKERGFQIVATHLEAAVPIEAIDFTRPTAMVFGNERDGVSEQMLEMADVRCVIPMLGFVQSFNISVAGAISLYHIVRDRIARQGHHGDLSERERAILRAVYYVRALKTPERLVPRLLA
ncbi:MAG: RNA methyltransferase [Bradymonadaceae bacterium]|nr:RNA methyltransferase [Lujinxingiaceae bacterium]